MAPILSHDAALLLSYSVVKAGKDTCTYSYMFGRRVTVFLFIVFNTKNHRKTDLSTVFSLFSRCSCLFPAAVAAAKKKTFFWVTLLVLYRIDGGRLSFRVSNRHGIRETVGIRLLTKERRSDTMEAGSRWHTLMASLSLILISMLDRHVHERLLPDVLFAFRCPFMRPSACKRVQQQQKQ